MILMDMWYYFNFEFIYLFFNVLSDILTDMFVYKLVDLFIIYINNENKTVKQHYDKNYDLILICYCEIRRFLKYKFCR